MSVEAVLETNQYGEHDERDEADEKKEYLEEEEEEKKQNCLLLNEEDVELTSGLEIEGLLHIYPKLLSLELSTKHLRTIEQQDLQQLCNTLQLTLIQRIKFKSIVHDIQNNNNKSVSHVQSNKYDYFMKVVIIGDCGVGKSSLLLRFTDWTFATSYISTIGIDFKMKTIKIDDDVIKMQIWDTAGQDRFRSITTAYYRGAHAIISCYDITQRETFENCKTGWMKAIEQNANHHVFVMVTGCKQDLQNRRQVTYNEGKQFAKSIGDNVRFCEVSSKTGLNVNGLFNTVSICTLKQIKDSIGVNGNNVPQNMNVNNNDGSWWKFATSSSCC